MTNLNDLQLAVKEIVEENGKNYDDGAIGYVNDVMHGGCISGIVTELIYYKDTHAWFDKHYSDIMALKEEMEEELGETVFSPSGEDLKNWFAWFSFEETVRKLYSID